MSKAIVGILSVIRREKL